jgi:crotonobetainyl-CoA:carnitine CoA-transferase CaiB-like acyl-CoA transferase
VLDLSRHLAAPVTTQMLADLGAEVIKVERPGGGDDNRHVGAPFLKGPSPDVNGDAMTFVSSGRSKKSVTVDMSKPEGQEIVRELARRSDVLVENFRVGSLAKNGLDYASIRKVNPGIIYCSVTGFGQTGPYAKRSGFDGLFQAMSGLMSLTGERGGPPLKAGFFVGDVVGGLYAALGVLAAIAERERNGGEGQHIDIALAETLIAAMGHQFQNFLGSGVVPQPAGSGSADGSVPAQPFRCVDGDLQVSAVADSRFQALCRALERPDLASDPRYGSTVLRRANQAPLLAELEAIFAGHDRQYWIDKLAPEGVVCTPIYNLAQTLADPQIQARGVTVEVEHPVAGPLTLMANPIRFSESEIDYGPPPLLGQHTDEVLGRLLGMDAERLAKLRAGNVL